MRKQHREAERLFAEMGFTVLGKTRTKHVKYRLRTPDGREVTQPIPHDTEAPRFWKNFRVQLRRHLCEPES